MFSVVKRSDNSALRLKIPGATRAWVVSYATGAYKVCVEWAVVESFEWAVVESLEWARWIGNQMY